MADHHHTPQERARLRRNARSSGAGTRRTSQARRKRGGRVTGTSSSPTLTRVRGGAGNIKKASAPGQTKRRKRSAPRVIPIGQAPAPSGGSDSIGEIPSGTPIARTSVRRTPRLPGRSSRRSPTGVRKSAKGRATATAAKRRQPAKKRQGARRAKATRRPVRRRR